MGKSLEFVKERIASGQCNGMENNKYESMIEQDIRELFTVVNYTKNGTILADVPYLPFQDLAVIFYVVVSEDRVGTGILMSKRMCRRFMT